MERKRQPNFNAEEIEMLVSGVERRSKLLFGKFGSLVSSAAKDGYPKDKGWEEVCLLYLYHLNYAMCIHGVRLAV